MTVVGLRGLVDPSIADRADAFFPSGVARLGGWIRLFKRRRIERVILAGSVHKTDMFARFRWLKHLPDWTTLRVWFFELADKRNDAVLAAVANEFSKHGITMESCVQYTQEHLAPEGVLTKRQPGKALLADADFGWAIAKQMGQLDIGQTVAVKELEVIAVEAIEGTDRMIERAAALCPRGGWTLIKVAKPSQDLRFDVPTVGLETIAKLERCKAAMLVIEAGHTVVIDRAQMIDAANRAKIVILGRRLGAPGDT